MKRKSIGIILICSVILVFSIPSSVSAATGLELELDYGTIVCGQETELTLNVSGGSGNYKYYLNRILLEDENGMEDIVDSSRLPGYQTSNKFKFTFYASGKYSFRFYAMDFGPNPGQSQVSTTYKTFTIVVNDPNYPTVEKKADAIAKACIDAGCDTDYEKALWLHDWLLANVKYDHSYKYDGSEGGLCRGTGTCESYHRAYVMLLKRVGIESARIEGFYENGYNYGHVWTGVKMDGKWYQVDCTHDDIENEYLLYPDIETHLYFGLSKEMMDDTRSYGDTRVNCLEVSSLNTPAAVQHEYNSLENNYFYKSGNISKWTNPIRTEFATKVFNQTEFDITASSKLPDAYGKIIYQIVAYDIQEEYRETYYDDFWVRAPYSNGVIHFKSPGKGDANLDGELNVNDITRMARHYARMSIESNEYALSLYDVNANGNKNLDDVTFLARKLAGII